MPFLTVLELRNVPLLPLFTILRNSPLLKHLLIGPVDDMDFPDLVGETYEPFVPGGLSSLSIDPFSESEFDEKSILGRFLECTSGRITSFHLGSYTEYFFPPSLRMLSAFQDFTGHIKHLSLGKELFNAIG